MSTVSSQAPEGGDVDRGSMIIALVMAECAVAIAFVGMRFYSRNMIKGLGSDDWLMLATLVLFIATSGILTELASIGGFRHMYYLTDSEKLAALKLGWIVQPFAIISFATSKASVALVLMRVIGGVVRDKRQMFCWFIIVSSAVINTLAAIVVFAQCSPPRALWTPGLEAKCWNPKVQSDIEIFTGCWNAFCDFSLAILPATIFYRLNLSVKRRIGLCILLGLGLFACVSAAIKTSYLTSLTARSDLTWMTFSLWTWSASETFLLIVCGSIPPIKPLYDRMIGRKIAQIASNRASAGYHPNRSYRSHGHRRWNPSNSRSGSAFATKGQARGRSVSEPQTEDQTELSPVTHEPKSPLHFGNNRDWQSQGTGSTLTTDDGDMVKVPSRTFTGKAMSVYSERSAAASTMRADDGDVEVAGLYDHVLEQHDHALTDHALSK